MHLSSNRGAKPVDAARSGKAAVDHFALPHWVAESPAACPWMGRQRQRRIQAASTVPAAFCRAHGAGRRTASQTGLFIVRASWWASSSMPA